MLLLCVLGYVVRQCVPVVRPSLENSSALALFLQIQRVVVSISSVVSVNVMVCSQM